MTTAQLNQLEAAARAAEAAELAAFDRLQAHEQQHEALREDWIASYKAAKQARREWQEQKQQPEPAL